MARMLDSETSDELAIPYTEVNYSIQVRRRFIMATRPDMTWGTPVDRKVSASEAKNSFGKLVAWVREENEPVIVENRGVPVAALISYEELEEFREMKWRKKAAQALEDLKQLQKEVSSRPANRNLTIEQADEIANDLVSGAIDSLVAKGKVRFED